MNLNWLSKNIIYITLGGSQAYGLNNELSDVDIKGICVPPRKIEDNLFQNFEQAQDDLELENRYSYLKNPKNLSLNVVVILQVLVLNPLITQQLLMVQRVCLNILMI